eukprot:1238533-Pyramimonas_sp.AAC.1
MRMMITTTTRRRRRRASKRRMRMIMMRRRKKGWISNGMRQEWHRAHSCHSQTHIIILFRCSRDKPRRHGWTVFAKVL